ncbi:hypothetical protein QMK19_35955 [Streptomyces sp. H10-C2]|uniref:MAB_1171c family putative transporter n=1 Tax=unclassified Streptomyces TaxID=2593676 RepID=UPI0024BA319A|nr:MULTISPECIES: MAB_1171c family putative transporter [unclassified Streptomyces]MDJ0344114.1 hypothetical protein [Streptomyces sp. PH10-H1]MDJ0374870.1 hypothetical protein [Streptomyces sp. H10-C2]
MITAAISAFNVAYPICASASFIALGYKLRDLRRDPHNTALRSLCVARLCTALAYVWITPWLYVRIDALSGTSNLSTLLSNGFIVLSSLATQLMMLGWFNDPDEARRKAPWVWAFFCAALVLMTVLFLVDPLPGEHPVDFEVHFAHAGFASAYMLVYLTVYGINLVNTARLTWPPSRALSRPWLRRSLRLTALGSVFVTGYLVGKSLGLGGRWAGTDRLDVAAVLCAPMIANVGSLVLVTGSTFPGWGQRIVANARQYRALRRLYPMWFALYQAVPGIALFPRRSSRPPVFVGDLEIRLYRLVIEIRDGQRALRPYVDANELESVTLSAQAVGLDGEELRAAVEASAITLGIQAHVQGAESADPVQEVNDGPSAKSLAGEIVWLERVARAFVGPSVRQIDRP